MKNFTLVLTEEAQVNPERFVPQLEEAVAARGCRNFQFNPTSNTVNVDFAFDPDLGQLHGVQEVV
jgi:hypothetical protein